MKVGERNLKSLLLNALTAVGALMILTDFTLSNARRFYSSIATSDQTLLTFSSQLGLKYCFRLETNFSLSFFRFLSRLVTVYVIVKKVYLREATNPMHIKADTKIKTLFISSCNEKDIKTSAHCK